MATVTTPQDVTVADLLHRLGGIAASRVRLVPTPGTATERDVIDVHDRTNRLCELVDGVLVEKIMGFDESRFAVLLSTHFARFLEEHDLGTIIGADGMVRLFPGLVRIPDVAFISWARFPEKRRKRGEIPTVAPDLVVEVLSKGNTPREMKRKLDEYFRAGVRLVWYVDPRRRTVRVYTAREKSVVLDEDQHLDGGDVLPGFSLSIRDWFDEAERTGPR
ncbi:MAG: Uma2 family endonuclease [Isosphaeraceae bacterium]